MKKSVLIMIATAFVLTGCNQRTQQVQEKKQKTEDMNTAVPKISDFPVGDEEYAEALRKVGLKFRQ